MHRCKPGRHGANGAGAESAGDAGPFPQLLTASIISHSCYVTTVELQLTYPVARDPIESLEEVTTSYVLMNADEFAKANLAPYKYSTIYVTSYFGGNILK